MVPSISVLAWGATVPWANPRQVEQDLIISRAIVALFTDPFLAGELRFRGGTALNKLHFPEPLRYSEDIDLVRSTRGPIGPVLDHARSALQPWLGQAAFDQSPIAPKLTFRVPAEDDAAARIRLKVEINTTEVETCDKPLTVRYRVDNPWFFGEADVVTFSREEMIATKLRALLQRERGRDLFDVAQGLKEFHELDTARVVGCLIFHLERSGLRITRAEAERRMFAKLRKPGLLQDVRPLLPAQEAAKLTPTAARSAFTSVFSRLILQLPGTPWNRTPEMAERFGVEIHPG